MLIAQIGLAEDKKVYVNSFQHLVKKFKHTIFANQIAIILIG